MISIDYDEFKNMWHVAVKVQVQVLGYEPVNWTKQTYGTPAAAPPPPPAPTLSPLSGLFSTGPVVSTILMTNNRLARTETISVILEMKR